MIRLILNGVECTNSPNGLQDLIESYGWNDDFMLFIREMSGTIECFGDDFDYLYGLLKNDPCTVLPIELQEFGNGQYNQIYTGQLFMTDIEFDADNRIARFELTDDNFAGLINNNSDINIPFALARTKYGQVNAALISTSISVCNFANTTCTTIATPTLYSCLDYAAYFCSNGLVRFYSDYLQNNTEINYYHLIQGSALRTGTNPFVTNLTTRDLYRDITRIFGLIGVVEKQTDGTYRMRYEDFTYWRNLGQYGIVEKFKDVKVRTNKDQFFQAVRLGSAQSLEQQPVIGWMQLDDFATVSDCNSKDVLDYQSQKIVYDAYVIDDILTNGTDQYDMNAFLVHDVSNNYKSVSGIVSFTVTNGVMNGTITNLQQAIRLSHQYCISQPLYRSGCEVTIVPNPFYPGIRRINSSIGYDINSAAWIVEGASSIAETGQCDMFDSGTLGFGPTIRLPNSVDMGFGNPLYNDGIYTIIYDINLELLTTDLSLTFIITGQSGVIGVVQEDTANGWASTFPYTDFPGYYGRVDKIGAGIGTVVRLQGRVDFIYSGNYYGASSIGAILGISLAPLSNTDAILLDDSSITVLPTINALNLIDQCQPYNYELQANGHISPNNMVYYRANPLNLFTIGHSLNNYTGQVQSLKRNVLSGQTDITLNTINV